MGRDKVVTISEKEKIRVPTFRNVRSMIRLGRRGGQSSGDEKQALLDMPGPPLNLMRMSVKRRFHRTRWQEKDTPLSRPPKEK